MKKTLLISSALASGIIYSGSVLAQTTVSGTLDLHYKAFSMDGTAGTSTRGIGREAQLNVANKGKLNNGMDYAAGFSLEFDGGAPLLRLERMLTHQLVRKKLFLTKMFTLT